MLKKIFTLLWTIIGISFSNAQIFTWKNPNVEKDSTKKDSIVSAKINRDFFTKDTLDFVKKQNKIIYDEAVLVKHHSKSNILGNLNSKGSIIRGITFGNNQGQSVQSSMNMQISGNLSPDVGIIATISDTNLPFQADGYTQTIREFDKIHLQLNIKKKSILNAGYLDLADDYSVFGKYQRQSMGLQFITGWERNGNKTQTMVSAGIARSEFHRMRFQATEGNQGPYRLFGVNGETFIVVLAGSEQVYIDGILMKRGEDRDYTINYNTGEISFTSHRPIFKQNFITISYNYTNRNYTRFLVTGSLKHEREKFKISFDAFLENDNKNAPLSLSFSDTEKQVLAQAGSDPNLMYTPSGVVSEYSVNKVLYRMVQNTNETFYEFSTNPGETLYQVAFTYFGQGKGDYRLKQTTNNGRVFEYIGSNLGDYKAVKKLAAPEKSQVFTTAAEYDWGKGKIGVDFSLSNRDVNLFSSKDNEQNTGYAGRVWGNKTFTKNSWTGITQIEFQRIDKNFHILDRINSVEFSRDFNRTNEFNKITQNRFIFSFNNQWSQYAFLDYRINLLDEQSYYKGIKNDVDFGIKKGKIDTKGNFSYLNTQSNVQNTRFVRGGILSEYLGKKGSWGIGGSMEHNVKNLNSTQTLDATSFSWKEIFLQKKIGDSSRTRFLGKIYMRDNDSVRSNRLENMNQILGIMAESHLIKTENTNLSTLVHYRKFFNQNQVTASQNQDFVLGNIQYLQHFLKNGLKLQASYELGNGQEAQREFQYLKVTDGQGIYRWTDYNNDGIQQLDEFEIAEYSDLAKYIRVYSNTVKYLPSNKNKMQLNLSIYPSSILNSDDKFLKRWNFNLSLLSQNSYLKKDKALILNPFKTEENQMLKNQNILASAQFSSTPTSGWNGRYQWLNNQNLINANFSQENRWLKSHILNIGYGFSENLRTDWENSLQSIENSSQLFQNRNFKIEEWESKPKIVYKINEKLQSELWGAYKHKKRRDGEELLNTIEITGTLQWENKNTSVRGNFSVINNRFVGNSFSVVGNQMLEGLKAGKNQVWNILLQRQINSFLQLNINYEGRNSGERTIHIGSMQVRASF